MNEKHLKVIGFMTSAVMNSNELHYNVQVRGIHIRKCKLLQTFEKYKGFGGYYLYRPPLILLHGHTTLTLLGEGVGRSGYDVLHEFVCVLL